MNNYIYKLVLINDNICISDKMSSIHGLWTDYTNRSYPQYCHLQDHCSTQCSHNLNNCNLTCSHNLNNCNLNISNYLSDDSYYDMTRYWCSYDMSMNNNFWCHEWCKHGCCTDMNITDYFNTALSLFKNLTDYSKTICYKEVAKKVFKIVDCE